MFTLSLGFLIFAGASFTLQSATIADTISSLFGSDINIFAPGWTLPLPEATLRAALVQESLRNGTFLRSWSFASFALRGSPQRVLDTRLSNLAGEPNRQIQVYGLESSHLQAVYSRFYIPTEWATQIKYNASSNSYPDVIYSLSANAGDQMLAEEAPPFRIPTNIVVFPPNNTDASLRAGAGTDTNTNVYSRYIDLVMSEAMRFPSTVSTTTPLRLTMSVRDSASQQRDFFFLAKARAMVRKLPGFFVSSYRQTATNSPVFLSMKAFSALLQVVDNTMEVTRPSAVPGFSYTNSSQNVPLENLWIRVDEAATTQQTQELVDRIRAAINDDRIQSVNIRQLVEGLMKQRKKKLVDFFLSFQALRRRAALFSSSSMW